MSKHQFTVDQESCIDTLARVFGGRHHLPQVKPFGDGVEINYYGDLSTYDFNSLTSLVLAAHRDAVRISVQASGPRMVKIVAFQRRHGDKKKLGFSEYHPDLKELVTGLKPVVGVDRLREIHDEASSEIYGRELNWGEVGTGDFLEWVSGQGPLECCNGEMKPIQSFDLSSVMSMFEEWAKGARP